MPLGDRAPLWLLISTYLLPFSPEDKFSSPSPFLPGGPRARTSRKEAVLFRKKCTLKNDVIPPPWLWVVN